MKSLRILAAVAALIALIPAARTETTSHTVEACIRPGQPWKAYDTRTLARLPGFPTNAKPPALDSFGGLKSGKTTATGFFRTAKIGDRWWLIDPEGGRFLHSGVASVRPGGTDRSHRAFISTFGGEDEWASATARLLKDHRFNGTGAWSDDSIATGGRRLVYTKIWSFIANYAATRGGASNGPKDSKYPNNCIPVFDPEFEGYCVEQAKQLAALRDDPWLLGHFTDNELPFDPNVLDRYLELPDSDAGKQAAVKWMSEQRPGWTPSARTGETTVPTDLERGKFLEHVVDRYFSIVARAIRKIDPNHLVLGSRFNGRAIRTPEVFRAAGPYLDVISVNYYNTWTPKAERLDMWVKESGKPCIISEFYVKGEDSGLPNTSGAGWTVRTQEDRGAFYQNFVLGLLELKSCVGWHWFRYMDNDPAGVPRGGEPENSNKGIVTVEYEPHAPLLAAMKELNTRIYQVVRHFDGTESETTKTRRLVAPEGVVIEPDVAYLPPDRKEKLDLYLPTARGEGVRSPAVVMIHGGGWAGGEKTGLREQSAGCELARAGYVAVSVEYMKEPGKRWPMNLHDCKNAVRWLRKNADRLHVDPERIGVMGGSAGGHLSLMVAYTSSVPELEPVGPYPGVSDAVQACVDLYGISNLLTRQSTDTSGTPNGKLRSASALFPETREEAPDKWKLASPVTHVNRNSPPTLIIHGTYDTTVDRDQSRELARVLAQHGVEHELLEIPGAGHAFALNDRRLPRDLHPDVIRFFDKHLRR